jgi:antitoxin component of RelBE/YafQ-DinJ toxin-antitoxin module
MILSNGEYMSKGKVSISKAHSNEDNVEFWDNNVFSDYWNQAEPVEFEIDIQSEAIYYAIDRELLARILYVAKRHGISAETLINIWLQEELQEDQTKPVESEFATILNKKYYDNIDIRAIDIELSDKIHAIAKQWNVSANDLANLWLMRKIQRDQLESVESDTKPQRKYRAIDKEILEKIHDVAKKRGISTDTILNLWLQEKLQEQKIESKVLVS